MNTLENPLTFIRSIKGAPASVLWALLFTRRAMTNQELQRWTGYASDAITAATHVLVDLGWLTAQSNYGPWSLAPGRQLPLMASPAEVVAPSSGLIGTPPSSSSITESDPIELIEEEGKDPKFVETLHALYDAGIREPTAGRLAGLPHMTPEYVAAHVEHARDQGRELGTAIYRMQHGWPVPRRKVHLSVEASLRRFLGESRE